MGARRAPAQEETTQKSYPDTEGTLPEPVEGGQVMQQVVFLHRQGDLPAPDGYPPL